MYMREVVGPGIGCGVNDYSGEYMNRELYKSNRERTLQLADVHGDVVCHSTLNYTPIATRSSPRSRNFNALELWPH
ncbi:hypothetical protein PC118_g5087 [Phytophthora cactorum]|uniref:Uncharacterized protein n=1 Tax=Phytophthora cactorum TaxID=29920 RepID=A0A8T1GHM6_9STRA|nr:hypothetical protein PC118_g5087 [Phytophthora cactorum]KAG3030552.1 hypothetical protein PC120_g3643 [Phytophthora cactorum]KAG3040642.1 hypothetical protein PC119_g1261 [Phytophthora cactorum]KAG3104032.1 hypothetical protein PC122_g1549 [Phytophthora cactorum]